MVTSWFDPDGVWRRNPVAKVGEPDEFRCSRCGHADDHRREAHYATCPYVAELHQRGAR